MTVRMNIRRWVGVYVAFGSGYMLAQPGEWDWWFVGSMVLICIALTLCEVFD